MFPRVVVRERSLSGEPESWYVYRDGAWASALGGPWWDDDTLPRVVVSREGWLIEATATAAGLLGIDPADASTHHFTDFIAPGTLEESQALFRVVEQGDTLTATVPLRPTSGDVIAVDLHARLVHDRIVGVMRLAGDVDVALDGAAIPAPSVTATLPPTDVAFRGYVLRALMRMPEPTADGLALRLRRLYPHATVEVDGARWIARRGTGPSGTADSRWWEAPDVPRVRYDQQALILEANAAAEALLGRPMTGHYWQEFVTPGSTEQVSVMLEILAEVGAAESRFRMPRADGTLLEFDSYTVVEGEVFTTYMRPVDTAPDARAASVPGASTAPAT